MATPFLKWVGGKGQLAPQLECLFPLEIDGYCEPFVGGGAIFFWLQSKNKLKGAVRLADVNPELINAYTVVRDQPLELAALLDEHRALHSKDYYYAVRAKSFVQGVEGAARTFYLNKTGFNGLYRVNSKGQFNVPIGSYDNPQLYGMANLMAASEALHGVELRCQGFEDSIKASSQKDFLYLDPPYVPLSSTASFTNYVPNGFGSREQCALAKALDAAHRRGVRWVLSNSATQEIESLYQDFRIHQINATRRINCDATKRGLMTEFAVSNFSMDASTKNRTKKVLPLCATKSEKALAL